MSLGVLTISQAAKLSGVPKRTLHRWILAREKVDPGLVIRLSKRSWLLSRAALAAMLGLDVLNIEDALERHGKDIDSLKRRVRALETRR
jgi:hypothetical protein